MSNRSNRGSEAAMAGPPTQEMTKDTSVRRRHHIPFYLIELGALLGDLAVILMASLLSGVGYQWLALDSLGNVNTFFGLGALVFANFFALTSAQQNYRPTNLINIGRQFRYVTLNWLFIFFVLTSVAFTLKIATNFSRGSRCRFLSWDWQGCSFFGRFSPDIYRPR